MCVHLVISDSFWTHEALQASVHGILHGKNSGMSSHSLLQGIFPTEVFNQVSSIASGFSTSWVMREALHVNHNTRLLAQMVNNLPAMWETWVRSLGWGDPLEEGMATHSSILAWRIPRNRGAWSVALQRVRHDWATKHSPQTSNF